MIFGPEIWREVRGETFTYWDRWLLRLAADDPHGVAGIVRQLEDRRKQRSYYQDDAEAKLAQMADLTARLQRLRLEPRDVLGDADLADKRLIRKAYEKVFKQTGGRFTPTMHDTPRRRLRGTRRCADTGRTSPCRRCALSARFCHDSAGSTTSGGGRPGASPTPSRATSTTWPRRFLGTASGSPSIARP